MSDQVVGVRKTRHRRRPRAWWQWTIGFGLIGAAVFFLSIRWLFEVPPDWVLRRSALEPTPFQAPEGMKEADAIPASRGSLAGSNVLLITLDTTRADRLGCYGNKAIETPHLDRLATEGVLFSRAISPAPTTLPSHCSILTGLYPYHHGARANGFTRLPDDRTTLAEVLTGQGYQTGAFLSAYVLDSRFGSGQGFSFYDDYLQEEGEDPKRDPERVGNLTTDHAIAWLRKTGGKKFFAWVHLFDPHQPYEPPAEYAEKYKSFLYDGEIAFADAQIGRLLQELEQLKVSDDTLIVVMGDHGQGMLQHLELTHGFFVYDTTLHVPLILHHGRKLGGVYVPRWVSSVDVMPTILALLGVDVPLKFDGEDLTQPPPASPRVIFGDTLEGMDQCAIAPLMTAREGSMKYIYGPDPELYDLNVDPHEENDIIEEHPEVAERLKGLLTHYYDDDLAKGGYLASTEQLTEEELSQLRALGYVSLGGGGGPLAPSAGSLPDPKTVMSLILRVDRAHDMEAREGPQAAIKYLESLIEEAPDFYMAHRLLGVMLVQVKDFEKAAVVLEECYRLHPDLPFPLVHLGRVYARLGKVEKSIETFEKALKAMPDDFGALAGLGRVYLSHRQPAKAVEPLHRAMMVRPNDQTIVELFASAMSHVGRANEAVQLFAERLKKNPDLGFVRNALGSLLMEQGKCDEVIPLMREGLKRHPDNFGLMNNLAFAMIQCHRPDDSFSLLEAAVLMEQVCRSSNYQVPEYLRTLGLVYGELRRFDEAISVSEKALTLANNLQLAALSQQLSKNIKVYREWKSRGITLLTPITKGVTTSAPELSVTSSPAETPPPSNP